MTDEQLNIACAEIVMGWEMKPAPFGATQHYYQCWHKNDVPIMTTFMWNPAENIEQAWQVQSHLHEHLGLLNEFIHELGKLMPPKHNLATVGPRERCIAALKAKGVEV